MSPLGISLVITTLGSALGAGVKIQDDTITMNSLDSDCVLGNYRLRCTAWGYQTYLQTTVHGVNHELISCASKSERSDRCWWGVYADSASCCDEEAALEVRQSGAMGKTCYCHGDLPLAEGWFEEIPTVIQSRFPSNDLCLSLRTKGELLEPCGGSTLPEIYKFEVLRPEEYIDDGTKLVKVSQNENPLYHIVAALNQENEDDISAKTESTSDAAARVCLKGVGTTVSTGSCSESYGGDQEALLWEVIQYKLQDNQGGYISFRASEAENCLTVTSNTTVNLSPCDKDNKRQHFLFFDTLNNESAAYAVIMGEKDTLGSSAATVGHMMALALVGLVAMVNY